MNNRKNHNSVLILATLGVYLGLVLVGATPQVLAQAAMTRQFNVKDEIEVKDDLDKNPKRADELDQDVEVVKNLKIAEAIANFISDLRKLEKIGKFSPNEDSIFSHKVWTEEYDTTQSASANSDISNPWLRTAVEQLISNAENGYVISLSDRIDTCSNKRLCRESRVEVVNRANDFSLTFVFKKTSPEVARLTAERFAEVFVTKKVALKNSIKLPIYQNIKVTSENNQVFIVTRLPRAGLDSLLATDAK